MTVGGRLHARRLEAIVDAGELRAPQPGWFEPAIAPGDLIVPGAVLGRLVVLGAPILLLAPRIRGLATPGPVAGARAVDFGHVLFGFDATLASSAPAADAAPDAIRTTGLVFRAPTSGRFYGRSSPDKPAFVSPGTALAAGSTVCLLEVMKTFHRVTYGGADLPDQARVRAVLVADGADVNVGDALLALNPA